MNEPRERRIGPWLVALGAGLWGTESGWRVPLISKLQADTIVFWEHAILVVIALPLITPRLGRAPPGARANARLARVLGRRGLGGRCGAVHARARARQQRRSSTSSLNIQPVLSTTAAYLLFRDRTRARFLSVGARSPLSPAGPASRSTTSTSRGPSMPARGYALACALFWGMSTVAGRGVMVEMSLPLAAGLRVVIGLVAMTVSSARGSRTLERRGHHAAAQLDQRRRLRGSCCWPRSPAAIPLLIYFKGLQLTRASTAGYFEMMQTLAAVLITWGVFGDALALHQVVAGDRAVDRGRDGAKGTTLDRAMTCARVGSLTRSPGMRIVPVIGLLAGCNWVFGLGTPRPRHPMCSYHRESLSPGRFWCHQTRSPSCPRSRV